MCKCFLFNFSNCHFIIIIIIIIIIIELSHLNFFHFPSLEQELEEAKSLLSEKQEMSEDLHTQVRIKGFSRNNCCHLKLVAY